MKKAKVFEETYNNYLSEIEKLNLKEKGETLGAEIYENGLIIPFYNKLYKVESKGISGLDGNIASFAIKVVLCKYILMCPQIEISGQSQLVTYREFKDAGPLTSYFANNTNKTIQAAFSGNLSLLEEKCLDIGGVEKKSETYDYSVEFFALPRVPILLNFNDKDEMFPAGCSILYQSSAEQYLDMECLAITGTYLTGLLI